MTFQEKYRDIQQRLQVLKTRENDFGGFRYRSIEDIETALKPLLKEHSLSLKFNDRPIEVGDMVFIESTAILSDGENTEEATAVARHAEKPKAKTDDAQLSGGTSSYCRKYAACGLFLIDDGKGDPDVAKVDVSAKQNELAEARSQVFAKLTDRGYTESTEMIRIIKEVTGEVTIKSVGAAQKVLEHLDRENDN